MGLEVPLTCEDAVPRVAAADVRESVCVCVPACTPTLGQLLPACRSHWATEERMYVAEKAPLAPVRIKMGPKLCSGRRVFSKKKVP